MISSGAADCGGRRGSGSIVGGTLAVYARSGLGLWPDAIYQFSKDVNFEGGSRLNVEDDLGLGISRSAIDSIPGSSWPVRHRLEQHRLSRHVAVGDLSGRDATVDGEMEIFTPKVNAGVELPGRAHYPVRDG